MLRVEGGACWIEILSWMIATGSRCGGRKTKGYSDGTAIHSALENTRQRKKTKNVVRRSCDKRQADDL